MTKVERVSTLYVVGGLACVVLGLALSLVVLPGPDLLWRLYIADGLLDGKVLYRDLLEVNPPLWFWAALPAAWVAQHTPILAYHALMGLNLMVIFTATALLYHVAKKTLGSAAAASTAFGFLLAMCLVSVGDFGQREQSLMMACSLWIALLCARLEGQKVALPLAILVGLLSAYGFALKHYFVLLPLVLEAWLLWRQKRAWRPFRPENLTLAVCAIAYAAATLTFTPDFLGRMLDLIQTAYYAFGPWNAFSSYERKVRLAMQGLFVFVPMAIMLLTKERRDFCIALAIAIVVCLAIVMLQQKGWRYHFIAAHGLSVMLSIMVVHKAFFNPDGGTRIALPLVATLTLIWTVVAMPAIGNVQTRGQIVEPLLKSIVAKEPKENRIFILSIGPDYAFHPLADAGRSYWSRYYSMWMVPGLLTPNNNPKLEAIRKVEKDRVRAEFIEDVQCSRPDLIIGEVGYVRTPNAIRLDSIAYLTEDPAFKAWLGNHYLVEPNIGPYPIRRLNRNVPLPAPCKRAAPTP
ncbi:hypothetical protein [Aquidulcibacter paucihalophilus]|uniref:hypothetical protein n=1 Tax=Aquidulcibacter paucihalophilus TaxID=1978549 RepID=UPI0012FFCB97|nr:hypothetical protein [Aquidulcibacter paucihalophilus]